MADLRIDFDSKLPFGMGFDDMIRTRSVRGMKFLQTNSTYAQEMMDRLVAELGYLDYRDFLAVNKYVLEAKKSKEYWAKARSNFLSYGLKLLEERRKEEVQLKWQKRQISAEEDELRLQDLLREGEGVRREWEKELSETRRVDDEYE